MASPEMRSVTVSQRLEECGLDPAYWSGVLRAAFDITSLDQVGKLGKEDIDKLMRCKQSESELEALHRFIDSTQTSSGEGSVTVSQRLEECGLDPAYWSGVLKAAFDITSLDQVSKLDRKHFSSLIQHKQSELELEPLVRFVASSRDSSLEPTAERLVTVSQTLKECGLDPVYWSTVLGFLLDITNLDEIGSFEKEDIELLERFKVSDSESAALNRFIVSSRNRHVGFIEKRINNTKRRQKKVKLLFKELCVLNEATDRSDNDVKKKADELCKALDIPEANWLKKFNYEAVATVIDSLSTDLPKLDQFLSSKNDLNTAQALDNASGGLALRGILQTDDQKGYIRSSEKLLAASCQPRIITPDKPQETFEVDHSSNKDFQEFNKTLQLSGFSVASNMKTENTMKAYEESKDSDGTVKDVHYSKTRCMFVRTMIVDFRETESCPLSTQALEELKSIDKLEADGADERVNSKCDELLKMFGSHFNLNSVLGGILKLDVIYSNTLPSDLPYQALVDMVNGIYDAILSSSFVGLLPPSHIKGSMNEEKMKKLGLGGTYDPSLLSNVSLQVERYGGSGDVDAIPLWKASLGLGSDICSVVDPPKLCAIWDKLPKILSEQFQHPEKLTEHLMKAREVNGHRILSAIINSKLTNWNSDSHLAKNAIAYLMDLQNTVHTLRNTSMWQTFLKESDVVPQFLGRVRGVESKMSHSSARYLKSVIGGLTTVPAGDMSSQTSNSSSIGTLGKPSVTSLAAGPPITQALEPERKKPTATSPTSSPTGTGGPSAAPLSPPAAGPECRNNADTGHELLSLLDLEKYYPQKISLKRVVSITECREEKDKLALPDIPWVILRKLLMINYEGRNTAWERKLSVSGDTDDHSLRTDGNENVDEVDGLDSFLANLHGARKGNDYPHPTDIFLATFSCCDLMLRQVLLEKMTMCRLSIPLVMPGLMGTNLTLCKWALRSVVLEYRRSKNYETKPGSMVEFSLVDCPMKVVSFVRIGEIPISKSQLLNGILSAQRHHTFFNKESCRLSTSDRSISNGMIEASWYIPNKRDDQGQLFDDVTMFLNLRGDAANFPPQARLLSTISSVVIVFVDMNDLASESSVSAIRTLYQSHQKFILVLTGTASDARRRLQSFGEKVGKEIMSATLNQTMITTYKGENQKPLIEIGHDIRLKLSVVLKERITKTYDELSQLVIPCRHNISIDENDEECEEGKKLADKVACHMQNNPVAKIKKEQLQIQHMYPEWSRLLKEQNRLKCKNYEKTLSEERERFLRKRKVLREDQCKKGVTPMLQTFTSTLIELINKSTTIQFFLQWLKLYFDKISRDHLPNLRNKYRDCCVKFNAAKGESCDKDLSQLKQEMDDVEEELAEASCGLEHLFREVGQLYEATKESKRANDQIDIDKLPEVAARLLLLGHPIELMDGDAANVPVTWVKAVLASLDALTEGNPTSAKHSQQYPKRVFVLSVLGIQSSGKSTLLNTMFGLRFAVSAGRCTRGVYAQLLEVDRAKTGLPFDYALVVDTEGLKDLGLSQNKYEHDNELATLAIGLGDVVILNIKGETASEMQDVLQIAVHAFLRMKRVDLQQACVFIHQNASAAKEKTAHGRQKMLDHLDEMAKQAAEQEEVIDIRSFNQIINIDTDKCVWYFSDLWQGDPPMAPVNPGYSKSVEKVRKRLLFDSKKEDFLAVQHLATRINDLWKGILADDFVFSFRNTLAVKAYSALEDMYHNVTWEIESSVHKWFSDTAQNQLERCETEDSLASAVVQLENDLDAKMAKLIPREKLKFEDFFEKDSLKEITIQWKDEKVISMASLARNVAGKTKDDIIQKSDLLKFELRNREKQEDLEKQILAKASELADEMKGKGRTDEVLQTKFDNMWEEWVTLLALPKERKEAPIEAALENTIHRHLFQQRALVNDQLLNNPLTEPIGGRSLPGTFVIQQDDISEINVPVLGKKSESQSYAREAYQKTCNFLNRRDSGKYQKQALAATEKCFEMIETYLNVLTSQGRTFQHIDAIEVVKKVIDFVDGHNSKKNHEYKFTFSLEYKVRLVVHVCRRAFQHFTKMREGYNYKHCARTKLKRMKNAAFNLFKNKVNCSIESAAAELFCDRIADSIKSKVKEKVAWEIFEGTYKSYLQKKWHFIVAILEDLACRDGFAAAEWGTFLTNPEVYALQWITRAINKRCFSPENKDKPDSYASIADVITGRIVDGIRNSVKVASEQPHQQSDSAESKIDNWMETFCNEAEKYLAVRKTQMVSVCELGVVDIDNFERLVLKQLDEAMKQIIIGFQEETKDVIWKGTPPYYLVMDKLWGCKVNCPFCNEPCRWTDADHCKGEKKVSHQCTQHRCLGHKGMSWDWRWFSRADADRLCLETCSYSIQENVTFLCQKELPTCKGDECHDFKNYKTYYPDWDIAPSPTMESSKFWMWVMATYNKELAELHCVKEAKIPDSWTQITREEALKSLRENL